MHSASVMLLPFLVNYKNVVITNLLVLLQLLNYI